MVKDREERIQARRGKKKRGGEAQQTCSSETRIWKSDTLCPYYRDQSSIKQFVATLRYSARPLPRRMYRDLLARSLYFMKSIHHPRHAPSEEAETKRGT